MKNSPLNSKGFGLLGVLVIVLVVAIAGFSGWFIWNKNHDTKKTTDSSNTNGSNKDDNTTTDPYEGWRTYCETQSKYCFRYPTAWSVESDAVSTTLRNAQKTVMATFAYKVVKDGGNTDFYVSTVEPVSALSSLSVVGGFMTDGNSPTYAVVNADQAAPLKKGEVNQFAIAPRYTGADSEGVQFIVYSTGMAFSTTDESKAWFETAAARESLLALKSLTYSR